MHRRHLLLSLPALAACQPAATLPPAPLPVVFFTEDSAALGDDARLVIAEAAARARANPRLPVAVLGFAGPAGSPGFNQAIGHMMDLPMETVFEAAVQMLEATEPDG